MARRDDEFELAGGQMALDAEWKRIQKKTFTRWCNEHLKKQQKSISDLDKDLCDGVGLIVLVEVLSQRKVGRYSKKPRVRAQRMENVELALDFITNKERIRLVNIGGGDIVDGNLKLILGLIWTLILHYQISIPFNLDTPQSPGAPKISPKNAILAFLQSKLPYEKITNLTTDWNDGTLIAKLVDAMAPGLCPEAYAMEPDSALDNASTAMDLADNWLGIPQLLEPVDMVNPRVDELSMITYLSQYPHAELKPGAPIRASGDPSKVKVYGPGVETEGLDTNVPVAEFTIDTTDAGMGKAITSVQSPNGPIECTVIDNKDGTYSCAYTPAVAGPYKVNVVFAGKPAAESPYKVNVAPGYNIGQVRAYGPGLQADGVKIGDPGEFTIDASQAGVGNAEVTVDGPYWRGSKPQLKDNGDGTYSCCYNPHIVGTYKVNVNFANEAIPESPFKVNVTDPSKVRISGPAVKDISPNAIATEEAGPQIISIHEPLEWSIDCTDAGPGTVFARVYCPDGKSTELEVLPTGKDSYGVKFEPEQTGRHRLEVLYSGNEVEQSPVEFSLYDASKVKVTGPGLNGGEAGDILAIDIDSSEAGEGGLSLSLIGPSQVAIDCDDHLDGTASLTFVPEVAGDYSLHVKFRGEDVPGSAFCIPVIDPTKVKVTGSGVTGKGARVGSPAEVIVDTREAGTAPVQAIVTSPSGEKTVIELKPTEEGVLEGEYLPEESGDYELGVKFADHDIPNSPFVVPICDPDAVTLSGTGLDYAIKNEDNVIDVATTGIGPNEVGCNLKNKDPFGLPVDLQVIPLDDSNHEVHFTPHEVGIVEGNVTYCNFPVHDKLSIPVCDPSAVQVSGPGIESGGLVGEPEEFIIDMTEAAPLGSAIPLLVEVADPDGDSVPVVVTEIEPNVCSVQYTPVKAGNHPVSINYANRDIAGSPFLVPICDPTAVKAYGPGLERAVPLEKTHFTVDATDAGEGALGLQIEGPAECEIDCKEVAQGLYEVEYIAPRQGIFDVHVQFSEKEIEGSPFRVPCERPPPDASKCIVSGIESPGKFTVDGKNAGGNGQLEVGVCGAYLPANFISVSHNGDYTFNVSYDIPEPGETSISVKWHGEHLSGSPFTVVTEQESSP